MGCNNCAKDMRHNSFVDNVRDLMTVHPELTWEQMYNDAMVLWTRHDYAAFKTMDDELGTEKAVELYAKLWALRTRMEWNDLLAMIDKKPGDKLTIHELADAMVKSFALYGNPVEIIEATDEVVTLRCYDCPYTTQVIWKTLSEKDAEEYNQKIQVDCNYAIFEEMLKLSGLFDQWVFNFPSQLCLTNRYCEFNFTKIARPLQ
ncbi:hypothetical protein JW848_03040 [Candidatus Bipolaricaulota bacterium]|nr:hypothetical protein [Candidatus Bipolaricaulota bacterium]